MNKNRIMSMIAVLVVGIMLGAAAYSTPQSTDLGNSLGATKADASVNAVPSNIADLVDRVGPSIVTIESTVKVSQSKDPLFNDPFFKDFFGDNQTPGDETEKGIGTGFIINDAGYIITNYHVVNGANSVSVKVAGISKPVKAKIVGSDNQLDLAVLKIDVDKKLNFLTLGNSDTTRVGDGVIAIGSPYGLDHTVTAGIISAKERPMTIEGRKYKKLIQTDAAINPGNSGGPLLTTSGQVIGINTAVNASAHGIGFAIPINTAKDVLNQLINKGKIARPYIGVMIQDISPDLASYLGLKNEKGAIVQDVVSGAPADLAGIIKGDVITKINNSEVEDSSDVTDQISNMKIGAKVNITIIRQGKEMVIQVTLKEKP
ncbi:MAG: trypsin-like peptidase domain-containing protein [Acidobacteriota bacterium]